jgi:hypothetical protein
VPEPFRTQLGQLPSGGGSFDLGRVSGVGQSFGTAMETAAKSGAPVAAKPFIDTLFAPFIGKLDHAFFEAFSLAIGQTFMIAVVTTGLAVVAVLVMRELPLRTTHGPRPGVAHGSEAVASAEPAPMAAMH